MASCCHAEVSEPSKASVKSIIESAPVPLNASSPAASYAALTSLSRSLLLIPFQVEKGSLQVNSHKNLPPTFVDKNAQVVQPDTSTVNYYLSPSFASLQSVFTSGKLQTESFLAVPTGKLDSFNLRYTQQPGKVFSAGFTASLPRKGFTDKVYSLESDVKVAKPVVLPGDDEAKKILKDLSFFSSNVKFYSDLCTHRGELSITRRLGAYWTAGVQAVGSFCSPVTSSVAAAPPSSCCAAKQPVALDAVVSYSDVNQQVSLFSEENHSKATVQLVTSLSPSHSLALSASAPASNPAEFSLAVGNRISLDAQTNFYGKFDLPANTFSFALKKQVNAGLSATITGVADKKDPKVFREWGFGFELDY